MVDTAKAFVIFEVAGGELQRLRCLRCAALCAPRSRARDVDVDARAPRLFFTATFDSTHAP